MKQFSTFLGRGVIVRILFYSVLLTGSFVACRKSGHPFGEGKKPSSYSADVIDKWLTLQIRLFKDATGISNGAFARPFAYAGITAFESLDPVDVSWKKRYNGLVDLPEPDRAKRYYWPASVNAALASFNRDFFTSSNSNAVDLAAIDSLENALNITFVTEDPAEISRSAAFGRAIAAAVFAWSETDGFKENNAMAYTVPVGPGLWQPTPPAFAKPIGPYWGKDRTIIAGSTDNTLPGAPLAYSEDTTSSFYKMVNDLYVASLHLTDDQKSRALFWRDVPGVTTPGHWLRIVQQVLRQTNSHLDKAALAYALAGICLNDGNISVMQTKYTYNLVRPVTYIRNVIGASSWLSFIPTPAHPEYSSAHSVVSAAASEALTAIFGNIGSFTDHTYDYLAFAPRTFSSFRAIAADAGNSRFYGGIHYQPSIDAGLEQGRKVAANILHALEFNVVKNY